MGKQEEGEGIADFQLPRKRTAFKEQVRKGGLPPLVAHNYPEI
jgi:hypothetical protein